MLLSKHFARTYLLWILFFGVCIFAFIFVRELQSKRRISELLEERPARVIARLSLEEKVGQLFHIGIEGTELKKNTHRLIQEYKVGGVILFASNLKNALQIRKLNRELQKSSIQASAIPLFISTDQEGGHIKRLGPETSTAFPSAMALGQTANPNYAQEAAFITAYELRRLGLNWVLAPVLDISNNPQNPVINVRSFGGDPKLVARMAKAYIRGNRQALSLSVIKHFPGHGDTDTDSHLALPRIDKNLKEIQDTELFPFRRAIQDRDGKAEAVMTAHILFPFLDPDKPATLSAKILKKLLRQDLGFEGLIITDAMEMKAISQRYTPKEAARLAFKAGVDIILLSKKGRMLHSMFTGLLEDFRKKRLDLADLDRALQRQLTLKMRRGLFHRWQSPYRNKSKDIQTYWQKREKKAQRHYHKLIRKYAKRGLDLNTVISRESITALRKPFRGLALNKFKRVRLLLRSEAMRKQALKMGIAPQDIHPLSTDADILRVPLHSKVDKSEIWLLELNAHALPFWNALLAQQKKAKTKVSLIALYTGNPFLRIESPQNGGILSSYSDTEASQAALVYRALYPEKPISQANLLLPEIVVK